MCGILGVISLNNRFLNPNSIATLNSLQKHRGPDDEGYFFFNTSNKKYCAAVGPDSMAEHKSKLLSVEQCVGFNGIFSFRRLSIVDLSARGHQPMAEYSGRYWIVFNGEIYNYAELRTELQQKGFRFQTSTDTEVILNAYRHWGSYCVNRFNGMWAFAIYDTLSSDIFISRDRFGVKPLYYLHEPNNTFAFASEQKPLLAAYNNSMNSEAIGDYLYRGYSNHTAATFWNRIIQLPPGCNALLSKGYFKINRYFNLNESRFTGSFNEACVAFSRTLADAIRLRQRSDVQLGFALSGGLDSSSLLGLSRKILPNDHVISYSLVFPDDAQDESKYIDAVNEFNRTQNHKFSFEPEDLLNDIDDFCLTQEQPFGGLSYYGEYKLKEYMHQSGVVVSIEGQGADEIISGYSNLIPHYFADLWADGRFYKLFSEHYHFRNQISKPIKSGALQALGLSDSDFDVTQYKKYASIEANTYKISKQNLESRGIDNFLNAELQKQLFYTSLPEQLIKADKSAMRFSIESRFPFLDYRLVEFASSLPYYYKINQTSKHILRKALEDVLPPLVKQRRDKIGFAVPVGRMVSDALFEQINNRLSESKFGGFSMPIFQKEFPSKERITWKYWKIASLILWEQTFNTFYKNNSVSILEHS
jgi:asparagine synthase (glutamine-hydrolysing)